MSKVTANTEAKNNAISDAEAEALLAELEATEAEATDISVDDVDDTELEKAVAGAEDYEPAEEDDDRDAIETATKKSEAKANKGKKRAAPGPKLAAGAKPSEVITALLGSKVAEYLAPTEAVANASDADAQMKAILEAVDKAPKKVGEKVINICKALKNGNNLSNYTSYALSLLKDGQMTTEQLRAKYLAHPYSPGTANAQSSQMMALMPLLGIATRSGNTLTLNKDSLLFEALTS